MVLEVLIHGGLVSRQKIMARGMKVKICLVYHSQKIQRVEREPGQKDGAGDKNPSYITPSGVHLLHPGPTSYGQIQIRIDKCLDRFGKQ